MVKDFRSIPILINARDLLTPLERLVTWLLEFDYHKIYILDNDSSYPPLLEYYDAIRDDVTMLPLGANVGHTSLWELKILERLDITTPFVLTDPDIVPIDECPKDVLAFFLDILRAYPHKNKVGFGLMISDIPDHYRWKEQVIAWESQFWEEDRRIIPTLYDSPIDTTFALYRPGSAYDVSGMRTGFPYLARHYPWYEDSECPSAEQSYYVQHARPGINNWSGSQLAGWLDDAIKRRIESIEQANRFYLTDRGCVREP